MRAAIELYRGLASLSLFGLFAIGSLVISPLMLVLRRADWCQVVVRACWRPLLFLFELTGLIRVRYEGVGSPRGCVLVANHPSLIDVVMLVARVPRTLPVAKGALLRNPFVAAIVHAMALPDDASLPARAAPLLRRGWNVLVFPEGTRTPADGTMNPFHRGAAQLALRTGASVQVLRIDFARRILGKRQSPWQMYDRRVDITIRSVATVAPRRTDASLRTDAQTLTDRIRQLLEAR